MTVIVFLTNLSPISKIGDVNRLTMKKENLIRNFLLLLVFGLGCVHVASAQEMAVKTNALYWATTSPNLSAEFGMAPHWTLEVGGGLNPFAFNDNRKWKHYQWQGEARYWICERFYRHFVGIHAGGGEFNVSRTACPWPRLSPEKRYEGWAVKAGVSYGYSMVLGGRWNLEATVGFGLIHADYDRYGCAVCADIDGHFGKTVFAPTKAGVSLVYMIR